jgi:hypothetical protein
MTMSDTSALSNLSRGGFAGADVFEPAFLALGQVALFGTAHGATPVSVG